MTTTPANGIGRALICAAAISLGACSQAGNGLVTGSIAGPSLIAGQKGPKAPERVSANIYRVVPSDRTIADRIKRENYTLLRAAETTRMVGSTHFVLVSAGDQPGSMIPSWNMLGNGGGSYGAYIRVLRLDDEQPAPVGAISADEIIQFFGPQFGRKPA